MFSIRQEAVKSQLSILDECESTLKRVSGEVSSIASGTGIRTAAYRDVQRVLRGQSTEIRDEAKKMQHTKSTLSMVVAAYEQAENGILGKVQSTELKKSVPMGIGIEAAEFLKDFKPPTTCPGMMPHNNLIRKFLEQLKEFWNETEDKKDNGDKDFWTLIKSYLGFSNIEGAGVFKKLISYVESLKGFFSGDKKGFTGASAWCSLANSSIGLWKEAYDFFKKKYDGLTTGFFGKIAQRNVAIAGLTGSTLNLIGSMMSASDGVSEKTWQTIVADYIGAGKDIVSVISDTYKLKHLSDVKSLANTKAGPWSALAIYGEIAKATFAVGEQTMRSYEKYSADGVWDLGDTGATGVDISITGLSSLVHGLSFGLDEVFYRTLDKATGGDGTGDYKYYANMSAEGFKMLADELGTKLGYWWLKNIKKR